jgi:hypothetical protein
MPIACAQSASKKARYSRFAKISNEISKIRSALPVCYRCSSWRLTIRSFEIALWAIPYMNGLC